MKIYNTFEENTSKLRKLFLKVSNTISKPAANNMALVVNGTINSNSIITDFIAEKMESLKELKPDSINKRISRFWNNKNINMELFYDDLIKHVLSNFKIKHNNRVYIVIDHTFNRDDFTSIVVTLCIGTQSIPIYFRCFEGVDDKEAFAIKTIEQALETAASNFNDAEIIYLADRWFNDPNIINKITSMCKFYVIRTKTNINVSIDNGDTFVSLNTIKPKKSAPRYFKNILFSETKKVNCNLVLSKDSKDPWYLITNFDCNEALKCYRKRFGGCEFTFKNQKSNGFQLEKTTTRKLSAFKMRFGITCIAILWMTIIGASYVKNKSHQKVDFYDIRKTKTGKSFRVISLFSLGMKIYKYYKNSIYNYNLRFDFKLYDI